MAKRGRPPKATNKRRSEGGTERQGTVSHRPLPEPVIVAGRDVPVAPPEDMPERAREVWGFIVAELATAGIIDKIDLPLLRAFCVQAAREFDAGTFISEKPEEEDDKALEQELRQMETIANALKARIGQTLQAGLAPDVKDVNAAARYATALENLRAYRRARKRLGNMVALGSMGQLVEHPLMATERQSHALLLRFATEFALTPTARARLGLAVLEGKSLARELDDKLGPGAKRSG